MFAGEGDKGGPPAPSLPWPSGMPASGLPPPLWANLWVQPEKPNQASEGQVHGGLCSALPGFLVADLVRATVQRRGHLAYQWMRSFMKGPPCALPHWAAQTLKAALFVCFSYERSVKSLAMKTKQFAKAMPRMMHCQSIDFGIFSFVQLEAGS